MDMVDHEYILRKYDQAAEQFIPSHVIVEEMESDVMLKLHNQIQKIFPG
jgi:hypothetical protein